MLDSLFFSLDNPDMNADPFSDILRLTNAQTVVTEGFSAGGSWAIRFPAPDEITFFAIAKGRAWVCVDGKEPVRAEECDAFLLSARKSFVLASDQQAVPIEAISVFKSAPLKSATLGEGHDFTHIGGHVVVDPENASLLADVLSPLVHVRAASARTSVLVWLIEQMAHECDAEFPGGSLALEHLAQLMFIQILRVHLETAKTLSAGWLRAASDKRLAPVLRMMHDDPARAWQLEELAKIAGMSRTTFAAYFKAVSGLAPLTYLTEWRMRLAARALRDDDTPINVIAGQLGYASESAFSNAFKRVTGNAPKRYRTAARASYARAVMRA
jgi:AraC-like DNA-binding protein